MGQFQLDSSIKELMYRASNTIFFYFLLDKKITGFMNVFPFDCSFLFTGEIISFRSNMSSNLLTLSCK